MRQEGVVTWCNWEVLSTPGNRKWRALVFWEGEFERTIVKKTPWWPYGFATFKTITCLHLSEHDTRMPGKICLCIFTHCHLPDRIGLFFEEFLHRLRVLGMHSDQLGYYQARPNVKKTMVDSDIVHEWRTCFYNGARSGVTNKCHDVAFPLLT
jgi:hypothetical protein